MKPSRLKSVLSSLLKQRWPAFVWGPPGVGKSSIVREVASEASLDVLDLRAALLDPTDLRGIPAIEKGRAVWCPPSFLPKPGDRPGVLFLDEINAAPPLVQASLYQLVLDRRVGEYVLPDGWWIVAAGNRQSDRSVVYRLSTALANRFIHIDFDTDVTDWREWALRSRLDPMVVGFISFRPALLLGEPDHAPAYPTPRSWEMLSDVISAFGGVERCEDLFAGIVGEGPALEFSAFARSSLREEQLKAIVDDPDRSKLPKALGELFALISWFAYHAERPRVRKAAAVVLGRIPPEFGVVLARDILRTHASFMKEPGYRAFIEKHGELIA